MFDFSIFHQNLSIFQDVYTSCTLCPNMCGVNRVKKEKGICGEDSSIRIAWSGLHKGEEPPLSGENGSGMIFFSGCPLGCKYCQNYQISSSTSYGFEITIDDMVTLILDLESMGAKTLNLVTGTQFIPSIIEALEKAKDKGFSLPVVWNSSGYERVEVMDVLDKYIDLYLADCKTLDKETSSIFCGKRDYVKYILPLLDYLKEKHPHYDVENNKGVLVRHLVFPGKIEATKEFLKVFSSKYKDSFGLSLMTQFVSPFNKDEFSPITSDEYDDLIYTLEKYDIDDGFMQDEGGDDASWLPDFTLDMPFPSSFAKVSKEFLRLKRKAGF